MKRKMVIGVEPTDNAGADALRLGRLLADVLGASPVVVAALPWPAYLARAAELQREADAEMAPRFALIRDEWRDVTIEARAVVCKSPAQALAELAEEEEASLIVLGSPHRGPVGRTVAGSVAGSLLAGAIAAVAVAPRGYAERNVHPLLRVAVAFDGSPESWAALETSVGLAERCHGSLTVITVADYPHYGYATAWSVLTTGEIRDAEHAESRRVLELALARVPSNLPCESRLLAGSAGGLLSEVSGDFDLMVAGSRGYGPLRRTLLGSTTRKLVNSSGCPLLILPRATGVDPLGLQSGDSAARLPSAAGGG